MNGEEWTVKVCEKLKEEDLDLLEDTDTQEFLRLISLLVRTFKGVEIGPEETDLLVDSEEFERGMERILAHYQQGVSGGETPCQFA